MFDKPYRAGAYRPVCVAVALLQLGCSHMRGDNTARPAPDLILTNARVYTVETQQPWAQAVAIGDGKIVAVGPAAELAKLAGKTTKVVDLGGRLLMPAFGDAHVHPVFGGMAFSRCSLHDGKTIEDYQVTIAGCMAKRPGTAPIYGVGWQDSLFPPNGVPRKELLDQVSTGRALIMESVGGHSYWVNSKTLELAGITKATPDPVNGQIDRDPQTGEPVGGLQESAMQLVGELVPAFKADEIQNSIRYAAKLFNSLGITNWHDAGIDVAVDGTSETIDAYRAVKERGELSAHVALALRWTNGRALEQIPAILAATERARAGGLQANSVKFYVDGVIPQRTAAMIQPYEGVQERGQLQIQPSILTQAVSALGAKGIQPYVHAIGDGAVRTALDTFETVGKSGVTLNRPMITHLNVIDPTDQPRFGKLGVIAQFQATWSSNYPYMDLTKAAIGPLRSQSIYPAGSVLKGGGMIAYGADWPVATADPLQGLQVAVTRINYEDPTSAPLLPSEALTLEQAVRAHTINAAYANGMDAFTGSIAPGKSAELIVLDTDIFTEPAQQISKARVILTLFKGRPVFGDMARFKASGG